MLRLAESDLSWQDAPSTWTLHALGVRGTSYRRQACPSKAQHSVYAVFGSRRRHRLTSGTSLHVVRRRVAVPRCCPRMYPAPSAHPVRTVDNGNSQYSLLLFVAVRFARLFALTGAYRCGDPGGEGPMRKGADGLNGSRNSRGISNVKNPVPSFDPVGTIFAC